MGSRRLRGAQVSLAALLLLTLALGAAGCTKSVVVAVPPRADLAPYPRVGVVRFDAAGAAVSEDEVTHRFLATVQAAQPGVRLLELGPEGEVLRAVGCGALDFQAIQAIGRHFGVDAVLTGRLEVSPAKPNFSVRPDLTALRAGVTMNGSLQAKLREAAGGATVWTNGAHGTWSLASLGLDAQGSLTHGGLADGDRKREEMLEDLVRVATHDFRPTYERHKVAN